MGRHILAALLAEGIEAQAAQLLQVVAENEAVSVVVVGGDAVAGEHLAHQWLPKNCRNTPCTGAGLRRPNSYMGINGWSIWLMRIRSAMHCRKFGRWWRGAGRLTRWGMSGRIVSAWPGDQGFLQVAQLLLQSLGEELLVEPGG